MSVRLRWKPGTNLRAGLLVSTAGGVTALLVADFGTDTDKAGKLEEKLRDAGAPVLRDDALVVGPAAADPSLRRWVPPGLVPLSYNPDRRYVGRDGDEVVKVHATAPAPAVRSLARSIGGTTWSRHRVGRTPWVPAPVPAPAVLRAAALLQRAPEPFRRLRHDWPTRTDALLAAAEQALDQR